MLIIKINLIINKFNKIKKIVQIFRLKVLPKIKIIEAFGEEDHPVGQFGTKRCHFLSKLQFQFFQFFEV